MHTITIISGTNRKGSLTRKIALNYQKILMEKGVEVKFFSLEDLPPNLAFAEPYGKPGPQLTAVVEEFILPVHKLLFVVPEYNGSYPGILKVMLDVIHPSSWVDKKAAVVGVASGRAGNLRGIEHLAQVLNYLKINVYHHKAPFGQMDKMINEIGDVINEDILKVMRIQMDGFLKF